MYKRFPEIYKYIHVLLITIGYYILIFTYDCSSLSSNYLSNKEYIITLEAAKVNVSVPRASDGTIKPGL